MRIKHSTEAVCTLSSHILEDLTFQHDTHFRNEQAVDAAPQMRYFALLTIINALCYTITSLHQDRHSQGCKSVNLV